MVYGLYLIEYHKLLVFGINWTELCIIQSFSPIHHWQIEKCCGWCASPAVKNGVNKTNFELKGESKAAYDFSAVSETTKIKISYTLRRDRHIEETLWRWCSSTSSAGLFPPARSLFAFSPYALLLVSIAKKYISSFILICQLRRVKLKFIFIPSVNRLPSNKHPTPPHLLFCTDTKSAPVKQSDNDRLKSDISQFGVL